MKIPARYKESLGLLKEKVGENLKFHHEFGWDWRNVPTPVPALRSGISVSLAHLCPKWPESRIVCRCGECADTCPDGAIRLNEQGIPEIDSELCLNCGQCVTACASGGIAVMKKGFRVLLGGNSAGIRRPRIELPGVYNENQVVGIVNACIDFYKSNSDGQRFGEIKRNEISRFAG